MAAPQDTSWGDIVTGGTGSGRIGIARTWSDQGTYEHAVIDVWFWSCYSVSDSSNLCDLAYYNKTDNGANNILKQNVSATISHTSNTAWDTSNQTLICSYPINLTKRQSNYTVNFNASFRNIDTLGSAVMYANRDYEVYALDSHTVKYNANGGTDAPSNQTKWYGTVLTLSSSKPTRTGYTFLGWGTSSTDTTVDYNAGANYGADADVTLYAISIGKTPLHR